MLENSPEKTLENLKEKNVGKLTGKNVGKLKGKNVGKLKGKKRWKTYWTILPGFSPLAVARGLQNDTIRIQKKVPRDQKQILGSKKT